VTVYKLADLPLWATKVTKIADAIVKQSVNDLLRSIEIVPGINRGGSRVRGTIPRDLGPLAASLQSSLYGSTAITGTESYVLIVTQLKAGDVARFAWGGNAAPYVLEVHYGANGVDGTFWVDVAANKWTSFVDVAVIKAKAAIQ